MSSRVSAWWRVRRARLLQLWAAGAVTGLLVTGASALGYLEPLETRAVDLLLFLRGQQFPASVVIVAIDDATFESLGHRQPLPRPYVARLVRGLQRSGAAVVGLDIALTTPTTSSGDAALAQAIRDFSDAGVSRVVLVETMASGTGPLADPALLSAVVRGSSALPMDPDGVIRRAAFFKILEPALGPTHAGVANTLFGLGRVLQSTGDRAGARAALERALGIYRGGAAPETHWRVAWRLAQIHEREGRLEEAAALYREATVTIRQLAASLEGQMTRARYLEASNRLGVFDALARVLLRLHKRDSAKGYELEALSAAPHALTVLSACETALGEEVPGAALITLAAAFSQAGAQSIVASLWKVTDAATRDFMVVFHRGLATVGRAAALQQAQLAVLRSPATAHPYYWAPFILIGGR